MATHQSPTRTSVALGQPAAKAPERQYLALLHAAMLLSGFGTVFLGPVLPRLAAAAHTTDSGSGLFFTAQFVGAFFGGATTSARLWRSLLRGCVTAAAGFLLLSLCVGLQARLLWHAAALLPLGYGVGQTLTTVNLMASQRWTAQRSAALARVNFSWSLGAVLAPFLLGNLLRDVALHLILAGVSCLFLLALLGTAWNARQSPSLGAMSVGASGSASGLHLRGFAYFALLLFVYGGVETSLGGWTTTFGQRYSSGRGAAGAIGTTVLWVGLTAGRAFVPMLLPRLRERTLLSASLLSATLLTALLSRSTGGVDMVLVCALLGLSLAPWFPLVFADLIRAGAGATQAGSIVAVSGIGAAVLPLLVGALSHHTGSLRLALSVPAAGLAVLLLLSLYRVAPSTVDLSEDSTERAAGVYKGNGGEFPDT